MIDPEITKILKKYTGYPIDSYWIRGNSESRCFLEYSFIEEDENIDISKRRHGLLLEDGKLTEYRFASQPILNNKDYAFIIDKVKEYWRSLNG